MRTVYWVSVSLLPLLAGAGARADDNTFDRQMPAEARGVVSISSTAGTIHVSGWDRAEVTVHADLGSESDKVEVTSEHGRTSIKVVQRSSSNHHGGADLQIKIPKESELDVSAVSADVTSQGVLGVQRLSAVSGNVTAELAGSDLELKTVSGDVKLKGHGQPARLHVTTVSGDLHLDHGAGDLEAGTVSGELVVALDSARSVRARTTSGDLSFEGKLTRGASFDAATVSGELKVRASADGGYAYEVSSFSGDITNCFGAASSGQHGSPGHSLEGTRGEGAGRVHLKSMSGDIELCDRP